MTVLYCTAGDLKDYILQVYLDKVEEMNPGTVARTLENVSGQITEAVLQGGYTIPDSGASAILKHLCAVTTAWRCVGDITSLMDTEASSGNEWIPLQRQFDKAQKDLDKIRSGNLDPFPQKTAGNPGISVASPKPIFGSDVWEKF